MDKINRAGFNGNDWYEQMIHKRTKASLEQQERQFAVDHSQDSDRQLLEYLCQCEKQLGRTPFPSEVIGGRFLVERFGGWENALAYAGLARYKGYAPAPAKRRIYLQELQRQQELYRREKQEKKDKRRLLREQRESAGQAAKCAVPGGQMEGAL